MAVKLNQHDLEFVLKQIKIAEAHANGAALTEIRLDANGQVIADVSQYDPETGAYLGEASAPRAIPDPKTPFGLRTVDGSYNNLVEGRELWGAADQIMPRMLDPNYRDGGPETPIDINGPDGFGPGGQPLPNDPADDVTNTDYASGGDVVDTDPRVISNLVVDMSVNNPAAIMAALKFAESEDPMADLRELLAERVTQQQADTALAAAQLAVLDAETDLDAAVDAYSAGPTPELLDAIQAAAEALSAAEATRNDAQTVATNPEAAFLALAEEKGLIIENGSLVIPNVAPDEGISAPFNGWMTFFGQFFDHGLDLITKGGNGTVWIPLKNDDPLVLGADGLANTADDLPPQFRFMVLTRATTVEDENGDTQHINTTTPFVDQNQTYTSHASHQVFLREYEMVDGQPFSTGKLLNGSDGTGLATWADVKTQAREMLGIELTDGDALNIPLILTDAYGEFIRGPNGFPQLVNAGPDNLPFTDDDILIEGNPGSPINTFAAGAMRIGHAFLDDIAHAANPFDSMTGQMKVADVDSGLGVSTAVTLSNGNFEADSMADGAPGVTEDPVLGNWRQGSPQDWTLSGTGGVYDPTTTVITETGHGGHNVAWLASGTLARDTGISLQAGRTYSLTFNVGDRLDQEFGTGTARLVTVEGTVLATVEITPTTNGNWNSVTLSTGAITGAANGQQLRIEFVHGGGGQILIDDVQLSSNVARYDNELLDRHFITGDGRGNENLGLTAVHHVFHSEHNRQTVVQKISIIEDGDLAFVNEWLSTDIGAQELADIKADLTAAVDKHAFIEELDLNWDGERIFQAARFATEMQYQHLVFEEFARKIQPAVDVFVFNSVTDIDPAIFSEFANTVYRFGHSMLTDSLPRAFFSTDPATNHLNVVDEGLIEAFLDPVDFDLDGTISHEQAAGAVVRGLTNVRGNEIDEFVVGALRNNLLGLPLDLAAINIARGRDTGMPTLNEAREQLFAATNSSFLKPYENWTEFAANLKNPLSVVNFIAAYGTHEAIVNATTLADKRAVAMELVFGVDAEGAPTALAGREEFLSGTGAFAEAKGGLDHVDLWIGGLAEQILLFGGMLGSTFNAIFEAQMENLQDADRFYYLTRVQGLNFLDQLEANAFSKLIMANTDLSLPGEDGIRGTDDDVIRHHIGVDSFGKYDYVLEVNDEYQQDYDEADGSANGKDPTGNDSVLEGLGLTKVVRDMPAEFAAILDSVSGDPVYQNYLRFYGGEHVVLGGSAENDVLIGDLGDEGIWGDGGDDYIEGGQGVDLVMGGAGDDIILDQGDTGDFLKGEDGDDVIANSNGIDVLMGGEGKDAVFVGVDSTEVFAGGGDDFLLGGEGVDFLLGNEGNDWIEAGAGFDTTAGDNSELFFNSTIIGHDVMFAGSDEHDFDAESGDDIMVQGESVMRNEGMFGFDWAIFKGMPVNGYADMRIKIFTTEEEDILRNRFDKTEALSGWENDDTLIGDDRIAEELAEPDEAEGEGDTVAANENIFFNDELTHAGVDRIDGLRELLGDLIQPLPTGPDVDPESAVAFNGGNILLGGGGSDMLQGNGGDDVLDGDRWLNVRIRITEDGQANTGGNEIATVDSLKHTFPADFSIVAWQGKSLFELMVARVVKPNQLHIVREIREDGPAGTDTAVFNDIRANYLITTGANGMLTVSHITVSDGVVDDGTDTLHNVEFLTFADGTFSAANIAAQPFDVLGIDYDAAGILSVDPSEAPDVTVNYAWEVLTAAGTWSQVGTGPTFNPSGFVGQEIRAVAHYPGGSLASVETAIVGDAEENEIDGTVAPNIILGFASDDRLSGEAGDDTIDGGAGNDRVDGGDGNDTLRGGAGDDDLVGRTGNNLLEGGAGNDSLAGGHGNDLLDGGDDTDTASFEGPLEAMTFVRDANGNIVVTDNLGAEGDGVDTLIDIEQVQIGDDTFTLVAGTAGTGAADIIVGDTANNAITGGAGNDLLFGGAGNDTLNGQAGDDTFVWNVGDGSDTINGAGETDTVKLVGDATGETYRIYSRAAAIEAGLNIGPNIEIVITRNETVEASVAARNASIVARLDNIEEIVIDGMGGGDTFIPIGDFEPTSLLTSTITLEGSNGDDVVDISALTSAHRIVFKSNGGNDTILGELRDRDVIELAPGASLSDYTVTQSGGMTTMTFGGHSISYPSSGRPAFAEHGSATPGGPGSGGNPTGAFALTARDLEGLKNLVQGRPAFEGDDDTEGATGYRDLEGTGNNIDNPNYGAATEPFIRLTEARYGAPDENGNRAINPIFKGLDPRTISNVLGEQEANLQPAASDASMFFMAFGQYFDHGLDFLPKDSAFGTIEIGGPGSSRGPTSQNPADLTRGAVDSYDENGVPQHLNKASPFVDQNQAYGSTELVGQFLRESDGQGGSGMRLLSGAADPSNSNFNLLPTLRELIQHHWEANTVFTDPSLPGGAISFRDYYSNYPLGENTTGNLFDEATGAFDPDVVNAVVSNFMGSGYPLLLDTNPYISLLDHYIAGDGRANENFALTSIHTIWARNHNFHVENLLASGFEGTPEEVFQAAKMLNEAEYQRVVFDEFADMLIGGMRGSGTHGHSDYNDQVNAQISHEFAAAVYRVGHSLIGENLTVIGPDGQPMDVALFDAFLNPSNDLDVFTGPLPPGYVPQPGYEQLGVGSIVKGTTLQASEEVDFNIVDAVRNDLVRINADLFAFNVARGWDVGLGTLNQIRADLRDSTDPYIREALSHAGNLDPYASWEDFQVRNGLSDTVIAQFKEAYPDLVLTTPEEIAEFIAVNPDIELTAGPNGTMIVKGIDRVDLWVGGLAEKHINDGMVGQTFWVVLHEQFDRLQEGDRFYYTDRFDNFDMYETFIDGQNFSDIVARNTGLTGLPEHIFEVDDEDDDDAVGGETGDDDGDEDNGSDDGDPVGSDDDDDDADDDDTDSDDDDDTDSDGDDDNDDDTDGTGSDDEVDDDEDSVDEGTPDCTGIPPQSPPATDTSGVGTSAADLLIGAAEADVFSGGAGEDVILGRAGGDTLSGGEGVDLIKGEDGADVVFGGSGEDALFGGLGGDMLFGDAGDDRVFGDEGDDALEGGAGSDTIYGGAGDDRVIAKQGDGDDVYFGEGGTDTLLYDQFTDDLRVDLGNGLMNHGSAVATSGGVVMSEDSLFGFENVVTGSGNDTIIATTTANMMDGGAGADTFVFGSAAQADGDTIVGFEPGDKIDLSRIDANSGTAGHQSFTLSAGTGFTAAGQVQVSYDTRTDGEYTLVMGDTDGDGSEDFTIDVAGRHNLSSTDFSGVS